MKMADCIAVPTVGLIMKAWDSGSVQQCNVTVVNYSMSNSLCHEGSIAVRQSEPEDSGIRQGSSTNARI
jgi:hypothetical protein